MRAVTILLSVALCSIAVLPISAATSLSIAGSRSGTPCHERTDLAGKGLSLGDGARGDPRTGGDTILDATVIPGLPYADGGATCGFGNDYDEVCPYDNSTAPDVVYRLTPASDAAVDIDLCSSLYDTKVYVYADAPGNLVACNDDAGCGYSGFQSKIRNLTLSAGVDYYIVVDGYGEACGSYELDLSTHQPCVLECPPGSLQEGEPICYDGYYDSYNGGCCGGGPGWTAIEAQANDCATLCGKSGTYLVAGMSYRDTDWFESFGIGATTTLDCVAEFPVQLIFIWGADCNNLQYDITTAGECEHAILSRYVADGVRIWPWVGPQVFTGVDCNSDYIFQICGIEGPPPNPVERRSWGHIKYLYK